MTSFPSATESQTGHIGPLQTRVGAVAWLRGLGCDADDAAIPPGYAHARITLVDFSNTLLMRGGPGVLIGEVIKRWRDVRFEA